MPPCQHRENLIVEYHEAVEKFSHAVKRLRECDRNRPRFEQEQRATELARQHAENDAPIPPRRTRMLGMSKKNHMACSAGLKLPTLPA
jgi:hypothetical protein